MKISASLIGALIIALAAPAVARADNAGDYIGALQSQGVTADRGMLIGVADDLCNAAAQMNAGGFFIGGSPNVVAAMRSQATLNGAGLSNDQVAIVLRSARNVYCPQWGKV